MSKSLRALAVCSQFVIVVATSAHAQSSPVVFQGLMHSAVGGATLRLDTAGAALEVSTLDPAGGDGVAVQLGEATSWTARFGATGYHALPLSMSWTARADGRSISTASMRQIGGSFEVSALFTGATRPTYSAQVFNDGRLVGAVGSLPPTALTFVDFLFCGTLTEICRIVAEFHNTANSECEWRFVSGSKVVVGLPNGAKLMGNELRLVEEVRPAGHYPYLTFDTMVMQSNAYSFALYSETVR